MSGANANVFGATKYEQIFDFCAPVVVVLVLVVVVKE